MEYWPIDSDLQAYCSVPPQPRAAVLLLHGLGEHAGRHAATLQALVQRGIAVFAYDLRGHGKSPGRRAVVRRFTQFVSDSLKMRERVAALHPELPLILMGVSMGGTLAVRSVQRDPRGIAGVVLIAPALTVGLDRPPAVRFLGRAMAAIAPAAPIAKLELDALSRKRAAVVEYAADPLTFHGGIPARTAAELVAAAAAALAGASTWQAPVLIVHGDADRISSLEGSRRFSAAAGAADITLRVVPDAFHEPLGEAGGDRLVDEIASWIVARTAPGAAPRSGSVIHAPAAGRVYTWRAGLAFGATVNVLARLLGSNTGRYETIERPWFAPPGWVFPVVWGINSGLSIWGNILVLNARHSADRTAYLRLWSATWLLYLSFGYAFFRRESPVLGFLVTLNFLALATLSAGRARRIDPRLWRSYVTLLPWLVLATGLAASVALTNSDPLLDTDDDALRV